MKKILIATVLFLVACSKSNQEAPTIVGVDTPAKTLDVAPLVLGGVNVSVESENLNFGVLNSSDREAELSIQISNTSNVAAPISWDASGLLNGFSVKLNRCPSSLDAKKSCIIVLSFKSRGLYDGVKTSTFMLTNDSSSLSLNLQGEITGSPNPSLVGSSDIQVTMEQPFDEVGLSY